MIRVEAIDMDLSAKFGNDSLVYSVVGCEPDPFKFYMDKKTGDMYSVLIVDADSDELMSKRRELYNINPNRYYESSIDLEWSGGSGNVWSGGSGNIWNGRSGNVWSGGSGNVWSGGSVFFCTCANYYNMYYNFTFNFRY